MTDQELIKALGRNHYKLYFHTQLQPHVEIKP